MTVERMSWQGGTPSAVYLGAFVVLTLLVSWSIALFTVTDSIPVYTTTLLMLTPALVVLALRRIQGYSIVGTIRSSLRGSTVSSLTFAFVYPVGFIGIASAIALATGLGIYQPGPENAIVIVIQQAGIVVLPIFLLSNLVITYGEELGWRGYLLPALTERWGRLGATAAVGVVWALFHSAFLFRAAAVTGVGNPLVVTVIQALAVFTFSFPVAYCYFLSNSSVVPVVILHFVWNVLNPWILGDIYANARGVIAGEVLLITGEGVLGVLLGLVALGGFAVLFKRGTFIR
ncbi:MAG TPA: type II CAAX endopeptidase family protein [Halococcus sp.]|nr:type II CAAX endopeptidase family protein [Halococcus sp.]